MTVFDIRNVLKQKIHEIQDTIFASEREVRFAHLGVNVGNEQNGVGESFKRPVLIIKRVGNMYFVVPMTTGGKDNRFYYTLSQEYFGKTSRVIFSQAKCIDKKRLTHKLGQIHIDDFQEIKKKLTELLL